MKQSVSPSVEEQQFSSFSFLNKRPALAPGHTLPLSVSFLFKQMNQMLTKTTNSEFDCVWLFQLLCNGLVLSMSQGGCPSGPAVKESLQCRKCSFEIWVRKIPWSRKWQPTPVFLPGESHGQRSLAGYSPWDCKESDVTQRLSTCLRH